MSSRTLLTLFVGVPTLTVVFLGLFFASRTTVNKDDAKERTRIEELFTSSTSKDAYTAFVRMNGSTTEKEQHIAAHEFGDVLYSREGASGFSACGPEFGFGCYHGFMGSMISELGVQAVGQLDAACTLGHGSLGLGCFHGIGHGLVSYYGYGEHDLDEALSLCGTLSWRGAYGGCADGAFMEYNLRTMQLDTGGSKRLFTEETRSKPCDSVPHQFRVSCQFNQGEWWRQSLLGRKDVSARTGGFCAELREGEERTACFRGIGYAEAAALDFDAEKGVAFCEQYATFSGGDGRMWCREGNAWALYATGNQGGAEHVCTLGLGNGESSRCLREYLFVIE